MKTAWEYIRKSDEDQSNFSISGQKLANAEFARRNNIIITRTFVDDGYSAKDFNRPDWKRLEAELCKNKVDFLIVTKYDRLIRNVVQGLVFLEKLEQKLNIILLSVMENYSIDVQDPYFFKHRADIFVDADFERRRISDRSRWGNWSGKSQGRYIGVAPFGYDNKRDAEDMPIIVINPEEKPVIEGIFTDFLNEMSFAQVYARAKAKGFPAVGNGAIQRTLQKHVYGGMIKVRAYKSDPEKIVPGMHEPIVPQETFWRAYYKVQEALKPAGPKIIDSQLPLRGFLLCQHCGSPHTGAKCKGKYKHYYYYWCNNCRGKNFSAIKVDQDMDRILEGMSLAPHLLKALKLQTQIELDSSQDDMQRKVKKLERESEALEKTVAALEKKFIQDKIDEETYQKWHPEYKMDLHKKKTELDRLRKNENVLDELYAPYMEYLGDLKWLYKKADQDEVQPFMRGLFPGSLTALDHGYRTPFVPLLLKANAAQIKDLLVIENRKEAALSYNLSLCARKENQTEHLLKVIARIVKAA